MTQKEIVGQYRPISLAANDRHLDSVTHKRKLVSGRAHGILWLVSGR